MSEIYTKDRLIEEIFNSNQKFLDQSKEITTFMGKVSSAVESINDTNVLHNQVLQSNSEAIKALVKYNKVFYIFFGSIIILLLFAVLVLAGAKEAILLWKDGLPIGQLLWGK